MRITDQYLAQFSAIEACAVLSAFSATGFTLRYLYDEFCWVAEPKKSAAKPN